MPNKEYTIKDVIIMLEDMRDDIRIIIEVQNSLKIRVDALFEMVAKNTEDIEMMKIDISIMQGDIKSMKGDIKSMKGDIKSMKGDIKTLQADQSIMKGDIKDIKSELKEIKIKLDKKSDKQELVMIDKRVTYLENKLKPAGSF